MKNNSKNQGVDLFTPMAEIFHEVCLLSGRALFEIGKHGVKRIFNIEDDMQKIERQSLFVNKYTNNPASIGIDTRSKKDFLLKDIDFSQHSFIVGASGFGKTNLITILQERYLKRGEPIIFFDPKGDLEALTSFKKLCESYGQTCHIFSEAYDESIKLNPVLDGTISQVVDRIMSAFEWSEPYYEDNCTQALRASLSELEDLERNFSLKNIYDVLKEKHNTKETVGLIVKLENIIESDFGRLLSGTKEDYTLEKIREERSCLYIGLSTQGYGKTAMALGKIFLGELLFNSYSKLRSQVNSKVSKENPIAVFFDEFGALVTPRFIELENKCRGAGIDLTMAVQTVADIDSINPELTIQVMENCSNWFILKQRVSSSAEMLSEAIGTILSKKQTEMTENGEKAGRGTEREVHELAVHPDIIKNLRIGQCVLLRQHPHKINHINIRKKEEVIRNNTKTNEIRSKGVL